MRQTRILGFTLLLLALMAASVWSNQRPDPQLSYNRATTRAGSSAAPKNRFDCLPKQMKLDQVVTYGRDGGANVTVEKTLIQMKARCRSGKLVDAKNREIRFFEKSCWGTPPPDAVEIRKHESEELERLKRHYTVIVMSCNRLIALINQLY